MTESEYPEIKEVCCEILFVIVILLFNKVVVEYPIIVHVDKIGDIFLLEKPSVSQWTKHINVRHHLMCNYVEDGAVQLKISFQKKKPSITIYTEPK